VNTHSDVLFEELAGQFGKLGIITLNRPKALNSLNHSMILAIHTKLSIWKSDESIKVVIIRAHEGRAFCAGGDLRSIYELTQNNHPEARDFFRDEYQLNRYIYHYPKPYIAFLDGITMGGGVGISLHGSHRVATDRMIFAMPETGIGFFPDVGGTYFLSRLRKHWGYYLGLCGTKLSVDDCLDLGIVQYKTTSESFTHIISKLQETDFRSNPHNQVSTVLTEFQAPSKSSELFLDQEKVDRYFSLQTMEEIKKALLQDGSEFGVSTKELLSKKSPTSLKVTLRALQLGSQRDFDHCMEQEFVLACRFLAGHDFLEGIRSVIIDKDQKPRWHPISLENLNDQDIKKYFDI